MGDKSDFDIGRMQGKSGIGGSQFDSEAYRQGLLLGATQRQNDILREQSRKESEWRENEERERRQQVSDAQNEIDRQEWAQQRREAAARNYDAEKKRAQSLLTAITEMIGEKSALRPLERDAIYFATQSALTFESEHVDLVSKVRQAGEAVAKVFRDEPTVHASIVILAHAMRAFRQKLAAHGLALPFNAAYQRERAPGESLLNPQFQDNGTTPAWLSEESQWLDLGLGKGFEGLARVLSRPEVVVSSLEGDLSELRRTVGQASAAGLWRVPPCFLAYASFEEPASASVFAVPGEMLDLVFAHRDFLLSLAQSEDNAELINQWIIAPNEKVAAFLLDIRHGRNIITNWLGEDNVSWPRFSLESGVARSNTLERLPFVSDYRDAVQIIHKRRSALRTVVDSRVQNPNQAEAKVRHDALSRIRAAADTRRPAQDLLEACTKDSRGGSRPWCVDEVDRKSAQLVCSLMGPFYFISAREAWIGAVVGVVLGFSIAVWGAVWIGLLVLLGALCLGLYGLAMGTQHVSEEISQHYTSLARGAYRACPKLTLDEKYELLHAIVGEGETQLEEMQAVGAATPPARGV